MEINNEPYISDDNGKKIMILIIIHFIFSFLVKKINNSNTKLILSSLIGFLGYYYLFKGIFIIYFLFNIPIYFFITKFYKNIFIIYILAFLILNIYQIYKTIINYGIFQLDFCIYLKVLFCKITYFSWYVYDFNLKKNNKISLFLFLNYTLCYLGSLGIPLYSFKDYYNFIYTNNNPKIEYKQGFKTFILGIIFTAINLIGYKYIPLNTISTKKYENYNIFYKFIIINISSLIMRFEYYGGFKLLQSSIIISGLSNINNIKNLDILIIEKSTSSFLKLRNWNISVTNWLRLTIYNRTYKKIGKNKSSFLVFLVSAFWHGIYPNYYIVMFIWYFLLKTEKYIFKNLKNHYLLKYWFYIYSYTVQNLSGLLFFNINWKCFKNILKSNYLLILSPIIVNKIIEKYVKNHIKN